VEFFITIRDLCTKSEGGTKQRGSVTVYILIARSYPMKRRTMVSVLSMVASCFAANLFAADDPFNGVWKRNAAKSKYTPGPGPQDETVTVTSENGTYTVQFQGKTAEAEAIEGGYTAKDDGTPASLTGSPVVDMISVRKINDRTVERRLMKAGKTVGQDRATVSPDGKTLTVTGSGPNPTARKYTVVFDKQS